MGNTIAGVRAELADVLDELGRTRAELKDVNELLGAVCGQRNEAEGTLDDIARMLSGTEWNAEVCDQIATILRATGRLIDDVPGGDPWREPEPR